MEDRIIDICNLLGSVALSILKPMIPRALCYDPMSSDQVNHIFRQADVSGHFGAMWGWAAGSMGKLDLFFGG